MLPTDSFSIGNSRSPAGSTLTDPSCESDRFELECHRDVHGGPVCTARVGAHTVGAATDPPPRRADIQRPTTWSLIDVHSGLYMLGTRRDMAGDAAAQVNAGGCNCVRQAVATGHRPREGARQMAPSTESGVFEPIRRRSELILAIRTVSPVITVIVTVIVMRR